MLVASLLQNVHSHCWCDTDGYAQLEAAHALPASRTACLTHSLPHALPASRTACLTHCLPHALPASRTACLTHSLPHVYHVYTTKLPYKHYAPLDHYYDLVPLHYLYTDHATLA